LLIRGIKK